MKITFFINNDYLDIDINKKYHLIGWGLRSLVYIESINEVIYAIENTKKTSEIWEMGYNSTYINIKKTRVRIADATDYINLDKHLEATEDNDIKCKKVSGKFTGYIDIELNLFKKILLEWKSFVKHTDSMTYSQKKSYRKDIELS